MKNPQARTLTNEQIDHIYDHFEHGEPLNKVLVRGVRILKSFRTTMGRYVDATATGCRMRTFPNPV